MNNSTILKIRLLIKKIPFSIKIYAYFYRLLRKSPFYYLKSDYSSLRPENYSKEKFLEIKKEAIKIYESWKLEEKNYAGITDKYINPIWKNDLKFFSKFIYQLPEKYLRNQNLAHSFGSGGIRKIHRKEMDYILNSNMADFFRSFKDSKVGFPLISTVNNRSIKTGSIDQIYFLSRISNNLNTEKLNSILDFGGGFGNMAFIARSWKPNINYTIIDFPEMLALQYIYHKLNFPDKKLNLIPIFKVEEINNLNPDIFISTFALSETTEALIDLVSKKNFFGAKAIYMQGGIDTGYQTYEAIIKHLNPDLSIYENSFEVFKINR